MNNKDSQNFNLYKDAVKRSKEIMLEHIKEDNVVIYDYIKKDYQYYQKEKQKKMNICGMSYKFVNFDIRLSSDLFIIDIKPKKSSQNKIQSGNRSKIFTLIVEMEENKTLYKEIYNKESFELSLLEKEYILKELKRRDPLNIERLYMFLNEFDIKDVEVEKYIKYIDQRSLKELRGQSRYVEVLEILQELEELKKLKNEQIYKKQAKFMYKLFDKYFQADFIYGIILLGSNIYSILANLDMEEKAEEVYYKLRMFLNINYDEMSQKIIDKCKLKVQLKSTSIFTLDEYDYYFDEINSELGAVDYFVYNNNLAAKNIECGNYKKAYEYLKLIKNQDILDKNTEGVRYKSIMKNNLFISSLFKNKDILIDEIEAIKEEHIIFELNYYAFKIMKENYKDQIVLINVHKITNSEFYKFHFNILNILIKLKNKQNIVDTVDILKIPNLYKKSNLFNIWNDLLGKLSKQNVEYKEIFNFFNDNDIKLLFIDFNIWDY